MKFTKALSLKRLTLRKKTILIFCLILTSLTSVVYFASSTILLGSLKTAEEQSARQSLQGVLNVLTKDQEALHHATAIGQPGMIPTRSFKTKMRHTSNPISLRNSLVI